MDGFETYDIRAWIVNGLSRHPVSPTRAPAGRRTGPASPAQLFMPMVASVAFAFYSQSPVAQWHLDEPVRLAQAEIQADSVPGAPVLYWSRAVTALRSAPLVEESGPADPPTPY
jgi:hypothetical protein